MAVTDATGKAQEPHRLGVALAANACMFIFGVVLLLMGSLLPSLPVSNAQAGSLGSFPLAGILLATLLVGPYLDLAGAKPALLIALALTAAALGVMSLVREYAALSAVAFAYGFGGGLLNTTTNALTADLYSAGRASALNLLGFSFSLGALTAPLLMSSIASLPPATVVRLLALVTALIIPPVLFLRFPRALRAGARLSELLQVLKRPMVWVFGLMLLFESGSENCMFVWSSKMLAETLAASARQANLALVGLTSALGAGRFGATFLLRKLRGRVLLLISAAIVLAGVASVARGGTLAGLVAGMVIIGLGLSAIFPTALGVAGDRFPQETGTVFGAIMTVALLGGIAGPKVAGALASRGPKEILWVPAVAAAAVFAIAAALGRRRQEIRK